MSNFKSGAGNLDFGSTDKAEENTDSTSETADAQEEQDQSASTSTEQSVSAPPDGQSSKTDTTVEQPAADTTSTPEQTESKFSAETYPYFVRRSNIGDERDTRLEIHVRDKVAEQEAKFRSELAEQLGASDISKTDAREFALLAAFHYPDRVAELMREEGFGALD